MRKLSRTQDQLDRDLRAAEAVVQSDFWTYAAPTVAVNTDAHTYTITPDSGTDQIRATIVHPSEATVGADLGLFEYSVTIRDAEGNVLATQDHVGIGAEAATADITGLTAAQRQSITIDILGVRSVSDPDTLDSDSILNDTVTLQVVQRDVVIGRVQGLPREARAPVPMNPAASFRHHRHDDASRARSRAPH